MDVIFVEIDDISLISWKDLVSFYFCYPYFRGHRAGDTEHRIGF